MSVLDYIPGMRAGHTSRNVILGAGYFLTFAIWLPLAFLWVPFYVGLDYSGITTKLDRIPGISPGGGIVSGLAGGAYVLIFFAVLGVVTPSAPADNSTSSPEASNAGAPGTATAQPAATAATTQTPAPTATATDTTTATPTATSTPASTPDLAVRVQYGDSWSGAISVMVDGSMSSRSVDGSGTRTIDIDDGATSISTNAQKDDRSGRTLTIQILRGEEVVAESSTSAEYGVASTTWDSWAF